MVAGIFAAHGVWVGTDKPANKHNPKGYFENIFFKDYMRHPSIFPTKDVIKKIMVADGYKGGPWLWKVLSQNHGEFDIFDPIFICCRRPSDQIFKSMRSSEIYGRDLSDNELKRWIKKRQEALHSIPILTNKVAQGDYYSLLLALDYCGIDPDISLIDKLVDKSLWHFH